MASGRNSRLNTLFTMHSKFGKTEAQLKQKKELRIGSRNLQIMMKDSGVVDTKYTMKLFNNDIARVLRKLVSEGTYSNEVKTFELQGFKQLIDQVAESKNTSADALIHQLNPFAGEGDELGYISNYKN